MKEKCFALLLFLFAVNVSAQDVDSQYASYSPDGVPFEVSAEPWVADGLGNHRAVVQAQCGTDTKVIRARLKWRRPDVKFNITSFVIVGQKSGQRVAHFWVEKRSQEEGIVWFEPLEGEDTYLIYYMPFNLRKGSAECRFMWDYNDYVAYPDKDAEAWRASLADEKPVEAATLRFEAVNTFEAFTQMGNIATASETDSLRACHPENPVIFPEDRCFPIRLFHQLPVRWVKRNPTDAFEGTAQRNEYYVWQIGLWAAHHALQGVTVTFSDLKERGGHTVIPASEQTCFNCTGTGWDGQPLSMEVNVARGDVQALWCGVQVPQNAPAGVYEGSAVVTAQGMSPREVAFTLHVQDQVLADKGDGDLWRLARLRWLNSTIGSEKTLIRPFKAMKVRGHRIKATEKTLEVAPNGLPCSASVNGREVLAAPIHIFHILCGYPPRCRYAGELDFPAGEAGHQSDHRGPHGIRRAGAAQAEPLGRKGTGREGYPLYHSLYALCLAIHDGHRTGRWLSAAGMLLGLERAVGQLLDGRCQGRPACGVPWR